MKIVINIKDIYFQNFNIRIKLNRIKNNDKLIDLLLFPEDSPQKYFISQSSISSSVASMPGIKGHISFSKKFKIKYLLKKLYNIYIY